MPEPVYHDALAGQQDITALERHHHRLLFGGGVFLSLVIVLMLAMSLLQDVGTYRSEQVDDFRNAKLALDSVFIQRDTSYVRTLNMVEYAWHNRSNELATKGAEAFAAFAEHDDQAVIQPTDQSAPMLVLGSGVGAWPQDKVDRYLGLANEMSVVVGTSLTARGSERGTMGYFYEPSETLFIFGDKLATQDIHLAADRSDREALFAKLAAPKIDFNDLQALHELREGNDALGFFGKKLPKILSSIGKNPATGELSVIGSFVAMDRDTPIGAFVVYEPVSRFVDQLRKATRHDMTVLSDNGDVAFDTGPAADSKNVAAAFRDLPAAQLAAGGIVRHYQGGQFFIAEHVAGSNWVLVRAYRWSDILRGESTAMAIEIAMAVVLLAILWALLTRQDRSVFTPVLARAKRVYQSDALNRTMIETSPVGLCVIRRDDAAPLLQNDLVRGYAGAMEEGQAEFYRQLLSHYADAAAPVSEPDVREFNFAIADASKENGRHLAAVAKPIVYRDRDALFFVLRDVTARAEIEENLRRARKDSEQARLAAESASRAKTAFVATMSHEIRTPLNGILGHLELLGHSKLEPAQRERLDRIRFSADTLLAIISDVLDFSRIEAGQLDIDPIAFELRPLVEQTVLLYAPTAQRKGLKLYFNIDSNLARGYIADPHRIRQILNNLVSNAVKFTESGRIVLRVARSPHATARYFLVAI
ncbi:histidine kinase dimerization/phospho-acceptor domain-containing protein [Dyella sp. 2HG41-7]|uniref:histidine kinase dimerization/phospho-acceptor domain-containing protein n=1 Tax=Dyella sp. 2HG41-7 TaxID=2883239 RepID=UPI001F2C1AE4|nr:histidine kinase dimerization/phospho-acceptor domain-containing protein [Dyella sp. 2HG41-7]